MPQHQERSPITPFTEAAAYLMRLAQQAENAGNKRSAQILLNTARLLEVDSESVPNRGEFGGAPSTPLTNGLSVATPSSPQRHMADPLVRPVVHLLGAHSKGN